MERMGHAHLDFLLSCLLLDCLLCKEFLLQIILALFCLLVTLSPSLLELGLDLRVKRRLCMHGEKPEYVLSQLS